MRRAKEAYAACIAATSRERERRKRRAGREREASGACSQAPSRREASRPSEWTAISLDEGVGKRLRRGEGGGEGGGGGTTGERTGTAREWNWELDMRGVDGRGEIERRKEDVRERREAKEERSCNTGTSGSNKK